MRHHEIICPTGTDTHPYVATIAMKPVELSQFERMTEGRDDIKLMGVDRTNGDTWTVFVGCTEKKQKICSKVTGEIVQWSERR